MLFGYRKMPFLRLFLTHRLEWWIILPSAPTFSGQTTYGGAISNTQPQQRRRPSSYTAALIGILCLSPVAAFVLPSSSNHHHVGCGWVALDYIPTVVNNNNNNNNVIVVPFLFLKYIIIQCVATTKSLRTIIQGMNFKQFKRINKTTRLLSLHHHHHHDAALKMPGSMMHGCTQYVQYVQYVLYVFQTTSRHY